MAEYEDLATAVSHLTGERISRFTHINLSVDDLIKKVQLLRAISRVTGSCFQRCVGWDALIVFKDVERYLAGVEE